MNKSINSTHDQIPGAVHEYWCREFFCNEPPQSNSPITLNIVDQSEKEDLSILSWSGCTGIAMSPEIARKLSLNGDSIITNIDDFYKQLREKNLSMHGADYLFYLPKTRINIDRVSHCGAMLDESHHEQVKAFQANCPEEELDNAYVELDHWAVAGLFLHDQLVSMASAYPWDDSTICDIGIITTPAMRQRGHAREVLWMLSKHIMTKNYIPQYRCQLDNHASIALAKSSGFLLYGTWNTLAKTP